MIFYFFGIEKRIGIKKLSKADLGISDTSNQTHIGLYNDVLQFLDDNAITTAMLVYGDYCKMLDCFLTGSKIQMELSEVLRSELEKRMRSLLFLRLENLP